MYRINCNIDSRAVLRTHNTVFPNLSAGSVGRSADMIDNMVCRNEDKKIWHRLLMERKFQHRSKMR